jgi:hypothetical protein
MAEKKSFNAGGGEGVEVGSWWKLLLEHEGVAAVGMLRLRGIVFQTILLRSA